jgi:hypothetical protein
MVHVGAVDAPITISDIKAVAREVWKAASDGSAGRRPAADILGWDFAFELNETARQVAAECRVDVSFKRIPRGVLGEEGSGTGVHQVLRAGRVIGRESTGEARADALSRSHRYIVQTTSNAIPHSAKGGLLA